MLIREYIKKVENSVVTHQRENGRDGMGKKG